MLNNEMSDRHLNRMTPSEIAQHLKDVFPEYGDLDVEELLLQQESALHYIQDYRQHRVVTNDYGETSNRSLVLSNESESSSYGENIESQLALDEAIARALEFEDDFNGLHISEHGSNATGSVGSTSRESSVRVENPNIRQDDFDPDTMTYEELQSLGESVGSESKGLGPDLISRLPTFKHKAGIFSRKKKKEKEQCVICYVEYKNGSKLIMLPCAHHYHSKCIVHWLQMNKQCPVCQKEVQDE